MTKQEAYENAQELLTHVENDKLNIELEDKKINFKIDKENETVTAVQLDKDNNVIDSTKYNFNKKEKDIKNVKGDDEFLFEKGLPYTDFKNFSEFCCVVVAVHIVNSPNIVKIDKEAIEKLDKELEEKKNKENEKNSETEKTEEKEKENITKEEPWEKQEKNPWDKSEEKEAEKTEKEEEKAEEKEKPANPWAEKLKKDKDNELER